MNTLENSAFNAKRGTAHTGKWGLMQGIEFSGLILVACLLVCPAQAIPPLKLVQTIPAPQVNCARANNLSMQQLAQSVVAQRMRGVPCHFDRFGLDQRGGRLFAVAEDNGTVEVYAIPSGKHLHTIAGFGMVHNVFFRSDVNRIYVSDESAPNSSVIYGRLSVFNGTTYRLIKRIKLLPHADSIDYDPGTHYLYVVTGGRWVNFSYTALDIVNTDTDEVIGQIRINTGKLEHMVMERFGPRLFTCLSLEDEIGVIDRKRQALMATWPVPHCQIDAAVDLDETYHRLFVACRGGTLDVLDTATGKAVAVLPIAKGTDDVIYDPAHKRIYVSCAEGFLDVYAERNPDHYVLLDKVRTGPMAKNCILDNSLNRLYVGVPKHGDVESKILVYRVQ